MKMPAGSEKILIERLKERNIRVADELVNKFALYHDLILEWSKKMNLVSRNDLDKLLERHILDSLTPIEEIPMEGNLADIGSGAGFPAIPIALVRPNLHIVMIESRGKRAEFLSEAIARIGIFGATVRNIRLEEYSPDFLFDLVTVRGLAINKKTEKNIRRIVKENGKILYYNKFNDYRLL